MRHSKRDFLKTDDVKLSMEKLSIPVFSSKDLNFKYRICLDIHQQFRILLRKSQINNSSGSLNHK